jgi:hypothetical protein
MNDRPSHVEMTATVRSDRRRVAKRVHPRSATTRLYASGHIDEPPTLEWAWASADEIGDLALTSDGTRLVSPRVREVFETHLGPEDEIQWIPGTVTRADATAQALWVPHFPVHHELLNRDLSTFGPSGLPILYVLSEAKLAGHAVTSQPGPSLTTIISVQVADALLALRATGIDFTNPAIGP